MGATASFNEKSFAAVGVTLVSVFAIGLLCKAAELPTEVTGAATSVALMLPAALAQRRQKRQADEGARSAGDPWHPPEAAAHPSVSPLHALILGGAIVLLDSVLGIVVALVQSELGALVVLALELAIVFLAMGKLVDWLGPKPYLTVTAAVGVTLVVRVFIMLLVPDALEELGMGGAIFVVVLVMHALILAAALAGLWRGRRRVSGGAVTMRPGAPAPVVATFRWPVEPNPPLKATPAAAAPAPPTPPLPPSGWYADPDLRGIERWWDGSAWSDNRRNKPS